VKSIRVPAAASVAAALVMALFAAGAQAQTYKVLYSFKGGTDGESPYAGLIQDAKGNLYGTTFDGGSPDPMYSGWGTVFKLSQTGKETALYRFCGHPGCTDGIGPWAGVTQDAKRNFYGTTHWGGASGRGTVFELSNAGKETVLYSLPGNADLYMYAGVIRDAEGNLYGTTPNSASRFAYALLHFFPTTPLLFSPP
jgi:uncharacterized repeat protein (TIGR03803 family)